MKQKQMDEENHKHWETSKDIRNNFSSDINEIKSGISGIVSSLNDIEEKRALEEEQRKETKRSELKDRIGDLYRHYNQTQEWNYMEEESLRDLIKEYEANGGLNSFVHDRVEPESYTWRLITKEELDNEKMKF